MQHHSSAWWSLVLLMVSASVNGDSCASRLQYVEGTPVASTVWKYTGEIYVTAKPAQTANEHLIYNFPSSESTPRLEGNVSTTGDFPSPTSMAALTDDRLLFSADGFLYELSIGQNVVQFVAGARGQYGYANGQFEPSSGTNPTARFSRLPLVLTFERSSALIIDVENHCLRLYNSSASSVATYAGNCTAAGSADGARIGAARFNYPTAAGVLFGPGGTIVVADRNGLRLMTAPGVSTIALPSGVVPLHIEIPSPFQVLFITQCEAYSVNIHHSVTDEASRYAKIAQDPCCGLFAIYEDKTAVATIMTYGGTKCSTNSQGGDANVVSLFDLYSGSDACILDHQQLSTQPAVQMPSNQQITPEPTTASPTPNPTPQPLPPPSPPAPSSSDSNTTIIIVVIIVAAIVILVAIGAAVYVKRAEMKLQKRREAYEVREDPRPTGHNRSTRSAGGGSHARRSNSDVDPRTQDFVREQQEMQTTDRETIPDWMMSSTGSKRMQGSRNANIVLADSRDLGPLSGRSDFSHRQASVRTDYGAQHHQQSLDNSAFTPREGPTVDISAGEAESVGSHRSSVATVNAPAADEVLQLARIRQVREGQYIKMKMVGRGSCGSVFSCVLDDGSLIAVKELLMPHEDNEALQEFLQNVHNEIETVSKLRHPNVIRYYGSRYAEEDSKLMLFMELAGSGTLSSVVKQMDARLPEGVARLYVRQVVKGLAFIHDQGVVHRDLKCDNVLMTHDGTCKLGDFGASKAIDMNKSRGANTIIGTPLFMAPEVLSGAAGDDIEEPAGYGMKADIWSLGVMVLELMNRANAPWPDFPNQAMAFMHIASENGVPIRPDGLSDACGDFLDKCLQRDPRKRATSAELEQHEWLK